MNVRSRITGTVEAFTVYMAAVGADRFATGARPVRLVAASPPDACSNFTVRFPGAVVLVTRGGCYFSDKIIHAQDAGAVGVIVANDDVVVLDGLVVGWALPFSGEVDCLSSGSKDGGGEEFHSRRVLIGFV